MIFIPLEHTLPRSKQKKFLRENLKLDLIYMLTGYIAIVSLSTFFIYSVVSIFEGLIPETVKSLVGSQPIWFQTIILIVVGDLYYYSAHRLFHSVPFLWKFHSIHHSIRDMDWIAAHRTHPIDTAITNSGSFIIAILFNFSAASVIIFSFQFSLHSLLKHSNVQLGWGPLRWLYLTPTFHHWHHANVKEAYDKNFSGQMPLWDVLFNTAIMKTEGPEKYGVDDPVPLTFIQSLLYPLKL